MSLFGLFGDPEESSDEEIIELVDIKEEEKAEKIGNEEECAEEKDETKEENGLKWLQVDKGVKGTRWHGAMVEHETGSILHNYFKEDEESTKIEGAHHLTDNAAAMTPEISEGTSESNLTEEQRSIAEAYPVEEGEREAKLPPNQEELFQMHLEREAAEIQNEIQLERRRWKPVYSDEEGEGVELKNRKRKKKQLLFPRHRSVKEGSVPGEGWKRLRDRAESKRKYNSEKYGSSYPKHKFPLRDY